MVQAIPAGSVTVPASPPSRIPTASENSADDVAPRIPLQIFKLCHRLVVEVEAVRLDEIEQLFRRKLITIERRQKRGGNRVGIGLFGSPGIDDVAPPLQADFARQRGVSRAPHAPDLGIEGVKRMQRAAPFRRCEQRRDVAVAVGGSNQFRAVSKRIVHAADFSSLQGIAIRPAPTRRSSIIITL